MNTLNIVLLIDQLMKNLDSKFKIETFGVLGAKIIRLFPPWAKREEVSDSY